MYTIQCNFRMPKNALNIVIIDIFHKIKQNIQINAIKVAKKISSHIFYKI